MSHRLWVFAHVMLLVYWLGADLGVLLLAREAKRPALSFGERAFALRMATVIDFAPRVCFALMLPVSLHVSASGGFMPVPASLIAAAWLVAAAWIALLVALARAGGTPRGIVLNRVHLALQGALLLVVGAGGLAALAGAGIDAPAWLASKILLFAVIFALGIGIDYAFRPVVPAFARLASEGSTPEVERAIGRGIDGAVRYVLALYALLIAIAFLGVVKPF